MIHIPTLVEADTFRGIFDIVANKATNDSVLVEVGTFLGGSICYLAQRIRDNNKSPQIYCVDTWDFSNIGKDHQYMIDNKTSKFDNFWQNIEKCSLQDIIKPLIGDSIKVSSSFKDKSIDFIFLDGCHDEEYVYSELEAWYPKMKDNSWISGHDYNDAGVRRAVQKFFLSKQHEISQHGESYLAKIGEGI